MSVTDAQLEAAAGMDLDVLGRGWRFMCRRRPGEPDEQYRERIRLARDGLARCDFCGNIKDAAQVSQMSRVVPGGGEARMVCTGEECMRAASVWIEEGRRAVREAEDWCPTGKHRKLECDCLVDEAAIAAAALRIGSLVTDLRAPQWGPSSTYPSANAGPNLFEQASKRTETRPDGFDQRRIDQLKAAMLATGKPR